MKPQVLLVAGALPLALSSVVILPGGDPRPYTPMKGIDPATDVQSFFNTSAENEFLSNGTGVIMSSFADAKISAADGLYPSGDSFVRGAIQAWGEHLHLEIRPDEVWFTILVQLNFYMNAHAEDLRPLFVDHSGQEVIYIEDLTWYSVLERFQYEIQARVKTAWLLDWIRPNFTTTTETDRMTANVLMMGLTQAYFRFEGGIVCGLPSVTLLGEQADWVALVQKLDRLAEFGKEPADYAAKLKPILTRFVASFVAPDAAETKEFWNNIAVAHRLSICGLPPVELSGWITGFVHWTAEGRLFPVKTTADGGYTMDNVTYGVADITRLPVGYARAPFVMRDFRDVARFEAYVAAGTLGKQITPGAPAGYADAVRRTGGNLTLLEEGSRGLHTTLRPLSAWMLYGPKAHNDTARAYWRGEWETDELIFKLRQGLVGDVCRA
ncbi:hypothetical protein QBC47DRAFT_457285 [Echria macrotheca]|uniref:Uncharacterized protein n=1 Tax=Echria macrotheca TaxID=438768 RepID=A0AAJ0BIH0_9PEZI|nr:hypothetical protein QBC47DRAFT_457285 [Echria macrotheca]